jgi:hypothetical protein
MTDSKVRFLPFNAINIFMRPDYQVKVVKQVCSSAPTLSEGIKQRFNAFTRKYISVPGFRNSALAPLSLRTGPYIAAFEKKPELAGFTLDLWFRLNPDLADKVFSLLKARDWELLPLDTDRTKLPGFLITWPKDEDFEGINQAFKTMYPEDQSTDDDISLMAVWLSGRLPYEQDGEEPES